MAGGPALLHFNPPTVTFSPPSYDQPLQVGAAISAVDFCALVNESPEGEPFTGAITSGALPTGLALDMDGCILSGTPTVEGFYEWTLTITNVAGATGAMFGTNNVVDTSPAPDCTTAPTTESECIDLFNTVYFSTNTFNAPTIAACDPLVEARIVTIQTPAAGAETALFAEVDFTVSGVCPVGRSLGRGARMRGINSFELGP
jgi:hypothetical protein